MKKPIPLRVGSLVIPGTYDRGVIVWHLPGESTTNVRQAVNKARAIHYKRTGRDIPFPPEYRERCYG